MDSAKITEIVSLAEEKKRLLTDVSKIMQVAKSEAGTIADMAEHPGWQIVEERINTLLAELLVPISIEEVGDGSSLSTIGAMAITRSAAIEVAEKILSIVNTAKAERAEETKTDSGEVSE